jgi:hypothetical protein
MYQMAFYDGDGSLKNQVSTIGQEGNENQVRGDYFRTEMPKKKKEMSNSN